MYYYNLTELKNLAFEPSKEERLRKRFEHLYEPEATGRPYIDGRTAKMLTCIVWELLHRFQWDMRVVRIYPVWYREILPNKTKKYKAYFHVRRYGTSHNEIFFKITFCECQHLYRVQMYDIVENRERIFISRLDDAACTCGINRRNHSHFGYDLSNEE